MFAFRRPDERAIDALLLRAAESSLTYQPRGLSLKHSADGFDVDEIRAMIGRGGVAFDRARSLIDSWQPLKLSWVDAHPARPRPDIDSDVIIVAKHLGFWSTNACRVVVRFPTEPNDRRYGFAYGTLEDHAECGEESFAVVLDEDDGTVWYQIRAVSKPRAVLARAGYPITRRFQRRFREESARAMTRAMEG